MTTNVQQLAPTLNSKSLVRIARTTGALYLSLAITGMLGFLLIRPVLFSTDAAMTLAHLRDNAPLARLGIALEMALVISQALAALWFYRLFRFVDDFAAGAIAAFGLINAVTILASASFLNTALEVALTSTEQGSGEPQLMYLISASFWKIGNLFFGLWLMPMGWCVLRSRWMPRALGLLLIAGGGGYILGAFVGLAPGTGPMADILTIPATIGEFWMIGYLLSKGLSRSAAIATPEGST